jgi:hypothetical protein
LRLPSGSYRLKRALLAPIGIFLCDAVSKRCNAMRLLAV